MPDLQRIGHSGSGFDAGLPAHPTLLPGPPPRGPCPGSPLSSTVHFGVRLGECSDVDDEDAVATVKLLSSPCTQRSTPSPHRRALCAGRSSLPSPGCSQPGAMEHGHPAPQRYRSQAAIVPKPLNLEACLQCQEIGIECRGRTRNGDCWRCNRTMLKCARDYLRCPYKPKPTLTLNSSLQSTKPMQRGVMRRTTRRRLTRRPMSRWRRSRRGQRPKAAKGSHGR
jgi:hypothetical protein